MIKALIDTNLVIDVALERVPFYKDAETIFQKIHDKKIQGCISASAVTDIFYLLRKGIGIDAASIFLIKLVKIIDIVGVDKNIIIKALESGWNDFEDAVQAQAALENDVDVIITRNTRDYQKIEKIKILSPLDFINYLE
jgi:predicted nucleic acid-binding protein